MHATAIAAALASADRAKTMVTGCIGKLQNQEPQDLNAFRDGLTEVLRGLRQQLRTGQNGNGDLAVQADGLVSDVEHLDASSAFMLSSVLEDLDGKLDLLTGRLRK